jgi:hypothetical protein
LFLLYILLTLLFAIVYCFLFLCFFSIFIIVVIIILNKIIRKNPKNLDDQELLLLNYEIGENGSKEIASIKLNKRLYEIQPKGFYIKNFLNLNLYLNF